MAEGRIKNTELSAIAAAIRSKNGESTRYKPAEMAQAILDIPTGGTAVIESKNITANGTYNAPTGVDGYNPVIVAVQPNLQSKTATENGTVTPDAGYDGLSSVVVNVSGGTPSGPSWAEILSPMITIFTDGDDMMVRIDSKNGGAAAYGVIMDTAEDVKITLESSVNGTPQSGTCSLYATMPNIISSGSGRLTYNNHMVTGESYTYSYSSSAWRYCGVYNQPNNTSVIFRISRV